MRGGKTGKDGLGYDAKCQVGPTLPNTVGGRIQVICSVYLCSIILRQVASESGNQMSYISKPNFQTTVMQLRTGVVDFCRPRVNSLCQYTFSQFSGYVSRIRGRGSGGLEHPTMTFSNTSRN
ncbi:hypothetical protein MPTK1_8g07870 [Marchantia polymorpha subsp. ruderalis]|uniref:Uncharacterized protein n=1 Tax=Marchantia polymorpha TaxID=3197 RepID=A0A2R6XI10_MARPO|nr:hypothetical protein MARPO_0013s0008 [Marchantia polymorpha]BBN19103.1 hypothetical protein Mp_8g07870 [Marchantia polymorpha subsp. ruderalis]|eukprot:PTQ45741.1 hypothetical protein MARPO_0013s0008 [Marchantia polymorpha]